MQEKAFRQVSTKGSTKIKVRSELMGVAIVMVVPSWRAGSMSSGF